MILTMKRCISSICLFLCCSGALPAVGQELSPTISVIGEASVSIAADEIAIYASIESLAKTASQACKDNQEKSRKLVEFLKKMEINEQHIDADLLSISSIASRDSSSSKMGSYQESSDQDLFGDSIEFEDAGLGSQRRIIGYRAFRSFAIVIKDFEKFENIYQGIVEQGINRVDRVEHRSSKEPQHREELRILAIRNAKNKASAMANELGAKLDSIKSISNESNRSVRRDSRGGYGMGDPFDSEERSDNAGKIRLESSVSVVFSLRDTELKQ
ncbi:MAG: SIMPL domain-containing protein [Pirellula sp.]|nr:SIMPL domain-containing protein [Pirellula sp.]